MNNSLHVHLENLVQAECDTGAFIRGFLEGVALNWNSGRPKIELDVNFYGKVAVLKASQGWQSFA
jgi:hypothetical protein